MSASQEPRAVPRNPDDALTDRELEVLRLVAAGAPSREIAGRLGIANSTVKAHLTSIYRKLGVANRVQATRHYLRRYGSSAGPPDAAEGSSSLIRRQMVEIQTRLEVLAPAAREAERLRRVLDELRAIDDG
jgi:DNA-binding CsgD family transcriptional regulator